MTTVLAATDVFSEQALTALVAGAILAGVPLMFAALGELVSQRAGVLNIGLEGMMLMGAYAGFVAAYHGGSEWLGYGAGLLAGAGVSLLMVLFCVRWGLDQIVTGIAITLTCEGATGLIFEAEFAESRPTLGAADKVAVPVLSDLPVVGGEGESNGSIFTQPLIVYIGLGLAVVVAWVLRRTHMGLNVRAAGDAPGALDAAGVSVFATRTWAVLFAGAMAGLGGACLAIVSTGLFQDTIVGGRGFIAIVLAMLARGRPLWAILGAMLFGASLSIADWAQVAQINISTGPRIHAPVLARPRRPRPLRSAGVPAGRPRAPVRARHPSVKGDNVMHDPDFTLSAGPTMAWPRVLAAQAKQITYHYDPAFMERFRDTERKLAELFLTKNDILLMQGEAVLGLEAAARGLVRPGHRRPQPRLRRVRQGHRLLAEGHRRRAARDRGAVQRGRRRPSVERLPRRASGDRPRHGRPLRDALGNAQPDLATIGPIARAHGA